MEERRKNASLRLKTILEKEGLKLSTSKIELDKHLLNCISIKTQRMENQYDIIKKIMLEHKYSANIIGTGKKSNMVQIYIPIHSINSNQLIYALRESILGTIPDKLLISAVDMQLSKVVYITLENN